MCKSINNDENRRKTFKNIIYDINCYIKDNAESFDAKSFKKDSSFLHSLKKGDIYFPFFNNLYKREHVSNVMQRSQAMADGRTRIIVRKMTEVLDPPHRNSNDV